MLCRLFTPTALEATMYQIQGWNSDFGLDKERKKACRQGKKDSWQDLTKARKRLLRQNSTKKYVNLRKKYPGSPKKS